MDDKITFNENSLAYVIGQTLGETFVPNFKSNYTLRYVFYRKSDLSENKKNACFSVITGLWSEHEMMFARIRADEDISSCIVEYVCEFDSAHCGVCYLVKEKEKEVE